MADLTQIELPDGNTYDIKDANATDTKVTQTQDDSTNNNFEILLAGSTSTSTATEGAKKTSGLVFNPSQQAITIGSRKANSTIGTNSFASGYDVEASGLYAHAEGNSTTASWNGAHAEGINTTASGGCAHTEGMGTTASSNFAHAEGGGTTASGGSAHAEGSSTTASGGCAHAEGSVTIASCDSSHAEGNNTEASGAYAHVEGFYTVANHQSQHVFGEYNILDPSDNNVYNRGNYVEIVGNGDWSVRSNARTLDWNGNEVLSGKLTVGTAPTNNMDVTTKQYVDTGLASADEIIEITATDYDALSYAEKHNGKYYHITDRNSSNELDTKVTQTQDDSTNATYEVLLAGSISATTATESAKKSSGLTYNPSTSVLSMGGTPSGNTDVVTKAYADGKVDKTGDTMTGDLLINKANGQVISKSPSFTINTSADNGVSATQIEGVIVNDSANYTASRFISIENSNGNVSAQMACFNKKTDGTEVNNYINATVKKDGIREYSLADPAAFRTAINAQEVITPELVTSWSANTTYVINSQFIKVFKFWKMVVVSFGAEIKASAVNAIILQDLPPAMSAGGNANYFGTITGANGVSSRMRIDGSNMIVDSAIATQQWYSGLFVYFIA